MITVSIHINGKVIACRSAVNKGRMVEGGPTRYEVDDGNWILHSKDDGAINLAIKMLQRIKEVK